MFPPPLRSLLAVVIAYVAAITAAPAISTVPSLTIRTSTPNVNIDGSESLKVTTTIANTGNGTLNLLNGPRGVFNSLPEDSFNVTGPSGPRPSFSGSSVDYASVNAANMDHPVAFTVLAPGDSINVTHDLPAAYSLTKSGTGAYSIEPSNLFTYADVDGTPKDFYATVEGIAEVKLSGNPAASRHTHDKRAKPRRPLLNIKNCLETQANHLKAAVWGADTAAAQAYSSLKSGDAFEQYAGLYGNQYVTWFGVNNSKRKKRVRATFKAIKMNLSKLTYDCRCDENAERNSRNGLYTVSDKPIVWVCRNFWRPWVDREGEMIREVTHIKLIARGVRPYRERIADEALNLAKSDPEAAVMNGPNYQFFTMEFRIKW